MTTENKTVSPEHSTLAMEVKFILSSFADGQGSPISQEWGKPASRLDLLSQIEIDQSGADFILSGVTLSPAKLLAQVYYWAWRESGYQSVASLFSITGAGAVSQSHFNKLNASPSGAKVAVDKTAPYKQLFDSLGVVQVLTKQGSSRWQVYLPVTQEARAKLLEEGFAIHGVILDSEGLSVMGWTISAPEGK